MMVKAALSLSLSLSSSDRVVDPISPDDHFMTELGKDDVLLGRGTGPNEHEGNVRFRILVSEIAKSTDWTREDNTKAKLARKVIATIEARGGRFVRKHTRGEAISMGKGGSANLFMVVPYQVAVDKTKQSFRHQRRILKLEKTPSSAFESTSSSLSTTGSGCLTLANKKHGNSHFQEARRNELGSSHRAAAVSTSPPSEEIKRSHPQDTAALVQALMQQYAAPALENSVPSYLFPLQQQLGNQLGHGINGHQHLMLNQNQQNQNHQNLQQHYNQQAIANAAALQLFGHQPSVSVSVTPPQSTGMNTSMNQAVAVLLQHVPPGTNLPQHQLPRAASTNNNPQDILEMLLRMSGVTRN
jgi:hypothetical protein